jgi:small GTP-binding protein
LNNRQNIKVVFAGDGAVGKTALVSRFTNGENEEYGDLYKMTIGTNISVHKSVKENGLEVTLILWDLGGQTRFQSIRESFYLGAHVVVLVYDITSSGSFKNLPNWLEEINHSVNRAYKGILIGNKIDLSKEFRAVDIEEAKSFAEAIGFMYLETSAKEGYGISEIVELLNDAAFIDPSQELVRIDKLF